MNLIVTRYHLEEYADSDCRNVVEMISAYYADPMGNGAEYPQERTDALIAGLRAHPKAIILCAVLPDPDEPVFGDTHESLFGEAVGMAICFEGFSTFSAKPIVNIHDLYVREEYRRQGVAKALFAAVEEQAKAIGACRVTLEVRQDNEKAQALYRSLGYGAGDTPMEYWGKFL